MNTFAHIDYERTGLTIQKAMFDAIKRNPNRDRGPVHIMWGGLDVQNADCISVPSKGRFTLTFISGVLSPRQGVSVKADSGSILLEDGTKVRTLRTEYDDIHEDVVRYGYISNGRKINIWNVYEQAVGTGNLWGQWSDNAGLVVESLGPSKRLYHCSGGDNERPDFDDLVFSLEWS